MYLLNCEGTCADRSKTELAGHSRCIMLICEKICADRIDVLCGACRSLSVYQYSICKEISADRPKTELADRS